MKDFVYYNNLFDIYGELLTDNEKNSFRDYYQEDMSLSEIADDKNISRSAVSKTINVVIDKLKYYEDILHIYKNNELLRDSLDKDNLKDVVKKIIGE
jgi:hypothetical protein